MSYEAFQLLPAKAKHLSVLPIHYCERVGCRHSTKVEHSKTEIMLTLLWLSQLQLNDIMSLLHHVFMSPILLRLNACVQCLQSNMCCDRMSGHCYAMLNELWTKKLYRSIPYASWEISYTFCIFRIPVQCQVLIKQIEITIFIGYNNQYIFTVSGGSTQVFK